MGFKPGAPRPANAGRKKGTPNRRTQTLLEICEEEKVDPFRALLVLSQTAQKEETRLGALKEVCQYLYPKRKAIEISGEINNPFDSKTLEELEGMVLERLQARKQLKGLPSRASSLPEEISRI